MSHTDREILAYVQAESRIVLSPCVEYIIEILEYFVSQGENKMHYTNILLYLYRQANVYLTTSALDKYHPIDLEIILWRACTNSIHQSSTNIIPTSATDERLNVCMAFIV